MADIFISYSQKDRAWVKRLVDALSAEGYEVWWDLKLRSGESFDEAIERKLRQVRCVVAVWSTSAVRSKYVRAESAWAKDHDKVVSIRIEEDLDLPLTFYLVHTESMVGWAGSRREGAFRKLLADIRNLAGAPEPQREDAARENEAAIPPPRQGGTPPESGGEPVPGSGRAAAFPEPKMVHIEPGTFLMGCPAGETGSADERPQHEVRIVRPFAMGKYAATFEEYDAFAKATGRSLPNDKGWGRGRRPVINVSWEDAAVYARWLAERTGKPYRLPSEAEWEYAARAGTSTPYSTGQSIDGTQANFAKNILRVFVGGKTLAVGSFPPNPWGLYEVHGNVYEWVQDCWHGSYEGAPTDGSAWLQADGGDCGWRVLRGGSWLHGPRFLRSAGRHWFTPGNRDSDIGFRLAQDL